jgi:cyanophycinase-like exopeptidase
MFRAEKDSVSSSQALADPFHEAVTVGADFLHIGILRGTITDSHFHARDRMGRTLVFLARILHDNRRPEARAIAIDEGTAALTEPDGHVTVDGSGQVYFIRARTAAEICEPGAPLTFHGLEVYRVPAGGTFELKTWAGTGGTAYVLDVEAGSIRSSLPDGSIY